MPVYAVRRYCLTPCLLPPPQGYLLFLPNLGAGSSLFQFAASAVATATSTVSTLCSAAWGVVASVAPATVTAPLAQLGTVVASWAASGAASWSAVGAGAWQWATLPVRVLSNAAAGQSSVPLSVLPLLPTYHLPIAWLRTFLERVTSVIDSGLAYVVALVACVSSAVEA